MRYLKLKILTIRTCCFLGALLLITACTSANEIPVTESRRFLPLLETVNKNDTHSISSSDPADPSTDPFEVLVLGASLSRELVPALEASAPRGVEIVDGTISALDGTLTPSAHLWSAALENTDPDVIVLTAHGADSWCAQDCPVGGSPSRDIIARLENLGDIPIVFIGMDTTDLSKYLELIGSPLNTRISASVKKINSIARKYVLAHRGVYVNRGAIATLAHRTKGPDGLRYITRKHDLVHLCPLATAEVAAETMRAIVGPDARPFKSWWKGDWWLDPKVNSVVLGGTYINGESLPRQCSLRGKR